MMEILSVCIILIIANLQETRGGSPIGSRPSPIKLGGWGGDYSKLFLVWLVLYALCHKKTENIFLKITFLPFTPVTRGPKNCKNPLWSKNDHF